MSQDIFVLEILLRGVYRYFLVYTDGGIQMILICVDTFLEAVKTALLLGGMVGFLDQNKAHLGPVLCTSLM